MISVDTSVHELLLDDITVGERFRKDLDSPSYRLKVDELTASMREHGLLHPIVISREKQLVAGFTRLTVARKLGWQTISARFLDECDEVTRKEIELEENLARSDMTWLDTNNARTALHKIKLQIYGQAGGNPNAPPAALNGWSVQKTADLLGITRRQVLSDLAISSAIELVPELAEESSKANVFKKIDRLTEDIEYAIRLIDTNQAKLTEIESSLWLGDCINEMSKIPTGSVDLIVTDPPYGIGYDSIGGSGYRTEVTFDDSPESILSLLRSAAREMSRVLSPHGHLYSFFGIQLWSETIAIYKAAGFDVDVLPLVWVKQTGGTVDWDHRYAPAWEPILFANGPARRLARKRDNVLAFNSPSMGERLHANEKPVSLLKELIEMSSQPGELVLDPFCGSGSTLQAAKDSGRRWIGIELEPRMYNIARLRLSR